MVRILIVALCCLAPLAVVADDVLAQVRLGLRERPPLGGEFSEARHFPFRREPVLLTGDVNYLPGRGLLLHYRAPDDRIVALSPGGLLTGSEDDLARRSPPAHMAALQAVFELDVDTLERSYTIKFEGTVEDWILTLDRPPAPIRAGRRPAGDMPHTITVRGTGAVIRQIEIVRPGAIRVVVEMEDMQPLEPDAVSRSEAMLTP